MILAAQNGHKEAVRFLISKGASIDQKAADTTFTPLMLAAQNGLVGVVKELLAAGALVEQQNNDGFSALMIASQNGHDGVVKALLAKEALINILSKQGGSALDVALLRYTKKNLKVVKTLMKHHIKPTKHTAGLLKKSGFISKLEGNPDLHRYLTT